MCCGENLLLSFKNEVIHLLGLKRYYPVSVSVILVRNRFCVFNRFCFSIVDESDDDNIIKEDPETQPNYFDQQNAILKELVCIFIVFYLNCHLHLLPIADV